MAKGKGGAARKACTAVAAVSSAFCLAVVYLLVIDYSRYRTSDPLNAEGVAELHRAVRSQPEDADLVEELRSLDLLARRAHFSSVAFRRRGALLLLGGVAVLLLALKGRRSLEAARPAPGPWPEGERPGASQRAARRLVAAGGGLAAATALALIVVFRTPTLTPSPGGESEPAAGAAASGRDDATAAPWEERTGQWPSFRGPDGLGRTGATGLPVDWDGPTGRNILWKSPLPRPGFNSPILWGERLFLTGADGEVREIYCYDSATGALLWRHDVGGGGTSPATPPEVTEDTGHAAPTAATDGRRVFAIFSNGEISAVDFEGRPLWNRDLGLPDNPYGHAASLLIWRDLLIVQYDQRNEARVIALDAETGELVWEQVRALEISWSSPVLIPGPGGMELVLNGNPDVLSYDPATGVELWRVECMSGELAPSPAFGGGTVFVANEYARLAAISPGGDATVLWEYFDGLPEVSSPVATEDFVFMANGSGIVTCLDRRSGELLWEEDFDEGFYASPVVAEGRVYLMDRSGTMQIFEAAGEFRPLSSPSLGEPSTVTGAFLDGRIYLRGEKNLYCVGEAP